jgi:short-subunit dehydrogenase
MKSMNNKRALITGASAGLGKEFAHQLAKAGKNLILVARRREPMEELAAELRHDHGVEVEIMVADLSDSTAPASLFRETQEKGLEVDYLINNAGAEGPDLIKVRDWERQDAYLRLMMTSVAAMCHEFLPRMIDDGYGRVINVASVAGLLTVANDYSYGPTKSYLVVQRKRRQCHGALPRLYAYGFPCIRAINRHEGQHAEVRLVRRGCGHPGWARRD